MGFRQLQIRSSCLMRQWRVTAIYGALADADVASDPYASKKYTSGSNSFPTAREFFERFADCGPIIKSRGIEIRTVGPDQGFDLGINSNLIEQLDIA